ncbi:hypothetical protein PQR25_36750 [Paraburkholderia nemoris]|uniref:hypothetical protein n=1 Tax=Paraburkholderia nemoris TaxID=2793076 RepID=UPI0038BB4F6D
MILFPSGTPLAGANSRAGTKLPQDILRKVVPTTDERRDSTAAVGRRIDLASALLLHVTAAPDGCSLRGAYALASDVGLHNFVPARVQ